MQLVSIIIRQFIFVNSKTGQKFIKKGCSLAVLHGLTAGDLGKSDYYHAENAQKKAVETDGNISADDARDFRRYASGKFLEIKL